MAYKIRAESSGKIQPTEGRYLWYPGYCISCSRPPYKQEEIWANLQVDIEQYGNVYLCLDCCAEVANFISFVNPDIHEYALETVKKLESEIHSLTNQLEEAKGLLNARIDAAGSGKPVRDGSAGVPLLEVESSADFLDRILDSDESVAVKSGKK